MVQSHSFERETHNDKATEKNSTRSPEPNAKDGDSSPEASIDSTRSEDNPPGIVLQQEALILRRDSASLRTAPTGAGTTQNSATVPPESDMAPVDTPRKRIAVGHFFSMHGLFAIMIGVTLNFSSPALLVGPFMIIGILMIIIFSTVYDCTSTLILLRNARKDDRLNQYTDGALVFSTGVDLSNVLAGDDPSSGAASPPSSTTTLGQAGEDAINRESASIRARNASIDITDGRRTANHEPVQNETDSDEERVYIAPNRQDTESGLRRRTTAT
jgi:hypothetical protein